MEEVIKIGAFFCAVPMIAVAIVLLSAIALTLFAITLLAIVVAVPVFTYMAISAVVES